MEPLSNALFDIELWRQPLEAYGAVTHLTAVLYNVAGEAVCDPISSTPLFAFFEGARYDPGLLRECARECLAQQGDHRRAIVSTSYGLGVVGTSLILEGRLAGAVVAGYALVEFAQSATIERLSRLAGVPSRALWDLARRQQPVPQSRLVTVGELLRVLGDTLLRENQRTRQYEEVAADLAATTAAKDEFLAVLSHELRTPLTPILGWAQMLILDPNSAQVTRAAQSIERNALLQMRLVEDLLELNRITRGKTVLDIKVHCLTPVIHIALEAIADAAAKRQLVVEFVDSEEPLCIQGDEARLQQIFRNVLLNALKFTPAGGKVTVTLTRDDDHHSVVRISDTGEGIAPEFLPFIFEIFRQQEQGTRRTHAGLGIGLALVKKLMEAHGGSVSVVSQGTGRGATVSMRFPLVADPDLLALPRKHDGCPDLVGMRILVVEDSVDSRDVACFMLQRCGADTVTASDGIEALAVAANGSVDLILCDLRMPRMDGFEFLHELRLLPQHMKIPVVAMSGLVGGSDHQRTQAAGFAAHIDKPFDESHLLAVVGAVINRLPDSRGR